MRDDDLNDDDRARDEAAVAERHDHSEEIGPAEARHLLATTEANLVGVDPREVRLLAKAIGTCWEPGRTPVVFSAGRERLLAGHEVLLAVIERGEPVELTIEELGLEEELGPAAGPAFAPRSAFVERGADPDDVPLLLASLQLLSGYRSGDAEPELLSPAELLHLFAREPAVVESVRWVVEEVGDRPLVPAESLVAARHTMLSEGDPDRVATFFRLVLFERATRATPAPLRKLGKGLRAAYRERSESPATREEGALAVLVRLLEAWREWNLDDPAGQSIPSPPRSPGRRRKERRQRRRGTRAAPWRRWRRTRPRAS